jgi:AcrR family transcriptional regulator
MPATPVATDEDLRTRILDAAAECILESGLTARLHATIAKRAGLSRPTLYKHVGDQAAILRAVLDREFAEFFAAVTPWLRSSDDLAGGLVDAIVFIVEYGRRHDLLQKALREHPELILPVLTTEAAPLMASIHEMFDEQLARALAATGSDLDPRVVADWVYRLIVSLLTTPATVTTHSTADLRRYVSDLVRLAGLVRADVPS